MQKTCSGSSSSSISSAYQQQQMQPDSTVPCGSNEYDQLTSMYAVGPAVHQLQQQQQQQQDGSAAWYNNPYSSYCYMPQQQQHINHLSDNLGNGMSIVAQQQQQQQQEDQQQATGSYQSGDFSQPGSGKYFWQYNAQGKGPKLACQDRALQDDRDLGHSDERKVLGFQDPVLRMQPTRSDKVRRGNANDIDPRPEELARLGRQLDDLRAQMCHPTKQCEKTEKNKLASRACRLRKKAQHEAFKIKLAGLQAEHTSLVQVLKQGEALLLDPEAHLVGANHQLVVSSQSADGDMPPAPPTGFVAALDGLVSAHLTVARVAGRSDQYVLDELDKHGRTGNCALMQQQQPHQQTNLLDSSSAAAVSPDCGIGHRDHKLTIMIGQPTM